MDLVEDTSVVDEPCSTDDKVVDPGGQQAKYTRRKLVVETGRRALRRGVSVYEFLTASKDGRYADLEFYRDDVLSTRKSLLKERADLHGAWSNLTLLPSPEDIHLQDSILLDRGTSPRYLSSPFAVRIVLRSIERDLRVIERDLRALRQLARRITARLKAKRKRTMVRPTQAWPPGQSVAVENCLSLS